MRWSILSGLPALVLTTLAAAPLDAQDRSAGRPELPRVQLDTRYVKPTSGSRTIRVRSGDDLQQALTNARRGDEIAIDAGATILGSFTLPEKPGTAADGWIIIRTSDLSALPAEGERVTPRHVKAMPKLITDRPNQSVIFTAPRASGYRLVGLEITAQPNMRQLFALVQFGIAGPKQREESLVPSDLILDRSFVHGHDSLNIQRCVALNGARSAVIDSWLSECHAKGMDSQAISGWNGPGPFKIENNYLEGAGENVMFGGADPSIPDLIPSDIEIRRNHFFKPVEWKGRWTIKNHLELKLGKRVLVEGNVFENCWTDGQTGVSILFKSVNQGGRATWAITSDVTFRYNIVRNAGAGVSLAARPEQNPALPAKSFLIEHNLFENIGSMLGTRNGRMFMFNGGVDDVEVSHNTALHNEIAGQFILFERKGGQPARNFVVRDNVATKGGPWSAVMGNAPAGAQALAAYASPYVFERNVIIGMDARGARMYPPNNHFPLNLAQVRFADPSTGDYRLSNSSPFRGAGTNKKDPGVDMQALRKQTEGVVVK
ncbi:MAG: right-handed parallel beta-helix repeat-containing protein [Gemmatimonadaceae bacterium]